MGPIYKNNPKLSHLQSGETTKHETSDITPTQDGVRTDDTTYFNSKPVVNVEILSGNRIIESERTSNHNTDQNQAQTQFEQTTAREAEIGSMSPAEQKEPYKLPTSTFRSSHTKSHH